MLIIIVLLQIVYVSIDFSVTDHKSISKEEVASLEKQFDSLVSLKASKKEFKIYPFNPNYITDYKGYQLGMSVKEIDRLFAHRKQGKFINSKEEFQQITKVSDSLLIKIAPYFTFPDWVLQREKELKRKRVTNTQNIEKQSISDIVHLSSLDLNKATASDFRAIRGVGEKLSERIVKYRKKLKGFTYNDQLFEVWKLDKSIAEKILGVFSIIEKPNIKKLNINTASFKEVLALPYIDYELCKKIFEFRDEVAELQSIEELKNIEGFPLEKYNRIVLYLLAQ